MELGTLNMNRGELVCQRRTKKSGKRVWVAKGVSSALTQSLKVCVADSAACAPLRPADERNQDWATCLGWSAAKEEMGWTDWDAAEEWLD